MNDEQTPALRQAVENVANMREAYDNLSQAAEAYNTGKTELAANITSKGVQASATETLPELAEKVAAISQETYEIDGGEMYAKQLFGSLETPNYWNLYNIMAQLLSDGRLVNYGGILLAEYYRGYDSLALAGAGAGGAYVVSDKDGDGNFIMYTEDTTHTWAAEFDGKGNRWVAYCFADEYHDFQITDTNTSPRSIFIGRKVGAITCLVNTRVSQIVVPDGNELIRFSSGSYTSQFDKKTIIRNLKDQSSKINVGTSLNSIYLGGERISGDRLIDWSNNFANTTVILSFANEIIGTSSAYGLTSYYTEDSGSGVVSFAAVSSPRISGCVFGNLYGSAGYNYGPAEVLVVTEEANKVISCGALKSLYIGYFTNDKTKSVMIGGYGNFTRCTNIELQDEWCKPLNLQYFPSLTKENVQAHIFDRLGVNDLSTGAVTITLANAVLNLFTQEEIDAVVERTNITIVGA